MNVIKSNARKKLANKILSFFEYVCVFIQICNNSNTLVPHRKLFDVVVDTKKL